MKKFFYLAVAVMTAFCITACSSDDDDNNNNNGGGKGKSGIQTPKYTNEACKITPSSPIPLGSGYTLETIDMGESGRCYFLIKDDEEETSVLNANYIYDEGVYTVMGKNVKGTVKLGSRSRASEGVNLIVKVTIIIDGKTLSCDTDIDGGVDAIKLVSSIYGDPDIVSTWKVRTKTSDGSPVGLLIDLKGDVNLFKTFSGGDLRNIRNEAEAQGAEFTDSEREEFEKTLVYVSFTKDYITLDYDDGTSDCGTWSWAGSEAKKFNMKMLSADMGNKFIVTNTTAGVLFDKDNGFLNVILNANITGNKNYTATLTLQLEQVPQVK